MRKLLIYGAGAYGKIILCDIQRSQEFEVTAFTMDKKFITQNEVMGLPVVPFESVDEYYPTDQYEMLVACGYSVMRNRELMYNKAKEKGYRLANYISPYALVDPGVIMGDNTIICAFATVGYNCVLGNNNIIRGYVYLGHESTMGDHNIISTGCVVSGTNQIGNLCFFGNGATGKGGISYGDECLIGAGSNVLKDVPAYATCYGNPAKVASYHEDTGVVIP